MKKRAKKDESTLRRVPDREVIDSLKLRVPDPKDDGNYIRVGPGHPLHGDEMAKRTAQKARDGDIHAAYRILKDFVGAMDQYDEHTWRGLRSAPIHWVYAQYLADAFEKLLRAAMRSKEWEGSKWSDFSEGDAQSDANLALGIKSSKPGRRKGATTYDDEALAAAFNLLVIKGLESQQAKHALEAEVGADVRTIEKANKAYWTYGVWARQAKRRRTSQADREHATEIIKVGAEPYLRHIQTILRNVNAAALKAATQDDANTALTPSQRIHAAWTRSGIIQSEFAAALGVSRATLRNWMRPAGNVAARTPAPIYVREAERIAGNLEPEKRPQ